MKRPKSSPRTRKCDANALLPQERAARGRQLRDAKIKPMIESFDAEMLEAYARACGWVLAHAYAKVSAVSNGAEVPIRYEQVICPIHQDNPSLSST